MGRLWMPLAALVGVAALVTGLLAWTRTGPFTPDPNALTFAPVGARTLGVGGDPNVLMIMFPWHEDGLCSGQFSVSARESEASVVVSQVTGIEWPGDALCAGLGTDGQVGGVELTLAAPLGQRMVTRAVDGAHVPVMDHCQQQGVPAWCPRPR